MKKIIFIYAIIVFAFTSCCDNVYINGDLDGMWQLQKVENSGDATVEYPQVIYYSFQRNLTFISKMNEVDVPLRLLGNLYYDEKDNTIIINGLRHFPDEKQVVTVSTLGEFMIFDTETKFIVIKLDKNQLVLNSGVYTYYLRRW